MTEDFWAVVPVAGRGSLPFALVHGESLVATASWALQAADLPLLDGTTTWSEVITSGRGLVLHDPLCPLAPPEFLAEAAELSRARSAVVVGTRPVTDTVKQIDTTHGPPMVGATVDRDGLVQICSPLVLPPGVLAELDALPAEPFDALVDRLRRRWPVLFLRAPASSGRVVVEDHLRVLEALTARP